MNRRLHASLLLAPLLWSASLQAAPPAGQSAYLNGMHDTDAASWMKGATSGCDRGWLTDLQYIGTSGTPAASCHGAETGAGISIIQRLDVSGAESIPRDPAKTDGYASAFAEFARQCGNIHVWIVGNEPNVGWTQDVDTTSTANAAAYVAVHKKLHALPGHAGDVVLLTPDSPYSPGCICSLRKAIQKVKARGLRPDGYALHPYTQAQSSADFAGLKGLVISGALSASNDSCGYSFHWHFRIYRDYAKAIEAEGETGRPMFLTESGNACRAQQGNKCYPDTDLGYFQALWSEVNAWNATAATPIRAITPYRWTANDDGTGRDFAIGSRPGLLADLKKAFDQKYAWTAPSSCGAPADTCLDDGACDRLRLCDLGSSRCTATRACDSALACNRGEVCRSSTRDCVPESRGEAVLAVRPAEPVPGDAVTLDAFSAVGYTHVEMELTGPKGSVQATWKGMAAPNFHWLWTATVKDAGTYRATFRADPAGKVYAIGYFHVASPSLPTSDAGQRSDVAAPAQRDSGKAVGEDVGDSGTVLADSAEASEDGSMRDASARSADEASVLQGGCGCMTPSAAAPTTALALALSLGLRARRRRRC